MPGSDEPRDPSAPQALIASLQTTLRRMETALDTVEEALLWTDVDGRILWCNASFEAIAGEPRSELLGRRPGDFLRGVLEDLRASRPPAAGERAPRSLRALCEAGPPDAPRTLQISMRPFVAGPRESHAVWVMRDVTEVRRLQRHLVQFDKMAALGRMSAILAHELRNPLSGVLANGQLLRDGLRDLPALPDGDSPARLARDIVDSGRRMNAIIENLLSFSRKGGGQAQTCRLAEVLEAALAALSERLARGAVRVERAFASDAAVRCHRLKLEQVFLNLMQNALQAMPRGGTLTVSVRSAPLSEALLREVFFGHRRAGDPPGEMFFHSRAGEPPRPLEAQANWVLAEVADTGRGLAPEELGRIFEPFFTTKPPGEGTGLGLMMCYQTVIDHGGHIWARSDGPERGARFSVLLPCEPVSPLEGPRT